MKMLSFTTSQTVVGWPIHQFKIEYMQNLNLEVQSGCDQPGDGIVKIK